MHRINRHSRVTARMRELVCDRTSPPLRVNDLCGGWAPNRDGTCTQWHLAPGPVLIEGITLRAGTDPADFEQLQVFLRHGF